MGNIFYFLNKLISNYSKKEFDDIIKQNKEFKDKLTERGILQEINDNFDNLEIIFKNHPLGEFGSEGGKGISKTLLEDIPDCLPHSYIYYGKTYGPLFLIVGLIIFLAIKNKKRNKDT